MAPSRRKGSSKAASAAAAAAARRQWKVGDLVLAKVKGFPAWPATVSEAEKWGYSTDWKKVLVYFFGTKQIAFCNPADVEAFTEEKKQTLLIKRQGKGSDFVRAVQEIVDCYEKSKKKNQVVGLGSGDEITVTNAGESEYSADHQLKDRTDTPSVTLNLQLKNLCSAKDCTEPKLPVEDLAVAKLDGPNDRVTLTDDPTAKVLSTGVPLVSTYSSRKRSKGTQPQSSVLVKQAPSTRRKRSSSKVDLCRMHSDTMASNGGSRSSGDLELNVVHDESLRRDRSSSKVPDVSISHDIGSLALVADGSIEDNGSEIATVDSDTRSLNEGSTTEAGCKDEGPDMLVDCLEEKVGLSKKCDQTKAVVTKKKRNLNRKHVNSSDTTICSARLVEDAGLQIPHQNNGKGSPIVCENSNNIYPKEDSDEHLPLVKRARVRMGKSPYVEKNANSFIQIDEKSTLAIPENLLGQVGTSTCSVSVPADTDTYVVKNTLDNSSPSHECHPVEHIRSSSSSKVDGEAALPPSKRLHRALEAMSANAAENASSQTEPSSAIKVVTNGCCDIPMHGCSSLPTEGETRNCVIVKDAKSFANSGSQLVSSGSSPCSNSACFNETAKSSFKELLVDSENLNLQFRNDVSVDTQNCNVGMDHGGLPVCNYTLKACGHVENPHALPCTLDGRVGDVKSIDNPLNELFPSSELNKENCFGLSCSGSGKLGKPHKELNAVEQNGLSPCHVPGNEEGFKVYPHTGYTFLHATEDSVDKSTKILKPKQDKVARINGTQEVMKEVEHESRLMVIDASSTSSKSSGVETSTISLNHNLSCSPAIHVDRLSAENVPCFSSSLSPFGRLQCPVDICHLSSDSSKFPQSSGRYSPGSQKEKSVHIPGDEGRVEPSEPRRPQTAGDMRNHADARAALKSFETMLGSLTRTKESIGRSTRIAIDCAKFSVAVEVVEILVRQLENESRLHKRVDLFFLVDSIAQCSRGFKGDVRGKYPSVIQAVLPRLLLAAAPPGNSAQENRRQCLKVLRLWLDRRILPESIVRHYMREIDARSFSSSIGSSSRRSSRTERAFHDPVREMEGMLDEYGSNSSLQLPGFSMPQLLKDEGESDSDGESFEAVTPERGTEIPEERITFSVSATERHRHILEDVDGELEMEDLAPCEEMKSTSNVAAAFNVQVSPNQSEKQLLQPSGPPLPSDMPPSSPPLPASPPPATAPDLLVLHQSAVPCSSTNVTDSTHYTRSHASLDCLEQPQAQQASASRINPVISDSDYHLPAHRFAQRQMRMSDSTSYHSPEYPLNSYRSNDNAALHKKAYHLQPPHSTPSNQFSYFKEQMPPRREAQPHFYNNRHHFPPNTGHGSFYRDHDRLKSAPPEFDGRERFPASSFPVNIDRDRMSYAHFPFNGPPPGELARMPNHRWDFPSRGFNHRNFIPHGPPIKNAFLRGSRAPDIWRPR